MPSQWEEDYRSHEAWTLAEEIQEILESYRADTDDEKNALVEIRTFNKAVLSLRDQPSIFVSDQALTELRNALRDTVLQNLRSWVNGNGAAYLDSANSSAENVRTALRGWPIATGTSLLSAAAAVRESARASQQAVADMSRKIKRMEEELGESAQRVTTQLNKQQETNKLMLESSLDATNSEIEALDSSVKEVEGRITKTDAEVTRLDRQIATTIDGWQDQFIKAETARADTHTDLVKGHREELQATLAQTSTDLETKKSELKTEADEILKFLEQKRSEAADLVGTIAASSTSNHYNEYAKSEARRAFWNRIGAIATLLLAVCLAVYVFKESNEFKDAKISTVLMKFGLGLPLAVLATYFIKEAGNHTKQEMIAKDLQLKMLALPPLISKVDDDDQKKLLTEAAHELLVVDRRLGGEPLPRESSK